MVGGHGEGGVGWVNEVAAGSGGSISSGFGGASSRWWKSGVG